MDFGGDRFDRLCSAIENVLSRNGFTDDLDSVLSNPHQRGPFIDRLTAELTVGESFFFRNEHHFAALREQVIPAILADNHSQKEIRFWSAGCSSGEEPYSLAILMDQLLNFDSATRDTGDWQLTIQGTDINPAYLRRARNAEYREWSFRRTDINKNTRYFDAAGGNFRLRSPYRDSVRFKYLNLVKDVYPSPLNGTAGLDLILFRNVAIYLHTEVFAAIVQRFHQCLRPGGWLLLGEAEVSHARPDGFEVKRIGQATFFQKPIPGSSSPAPVKSRFSTVESALRPQTSSPKTSASTVDVLPVKPAKAREVSPPAASAEVQQSKFEWDHVEVSLIRKDYDHAETLVDGIRDRQQRATTKLALVRRLLELSQSQRARVTLDNCLEDEPLIIDGHLLKACLAEESGDLVQAERACRRALYLDRECAMAYFQLALVQQLSGDTTGSKKSLQRVQNIADGNDKNALVEHGDGVCYGRLWEMAQLLART